ncbi:MAG: hypothetical protein ACOX61_11365 [Brooklawnia sp.]
MQTLYRVLAFVVVGLVAVQAASHAWGSAGLVKYLSEGGTLDMDAMTPFTEVAGYVIHAMNGMYVIPAVAVILLTVAFISRNSVAIIWAAVVAVLVVLLVAFGLLGHETTAFAFLHGITAVALAGAALVAALRVQLATGGHQSRTAQHAVQNR